MTVNQPSNQMQIVARVRPPPENNQIISHQIVYCQTDQYNKLYPVKRTSSLTCETLTEWTAMGVYINGACRDEGGPKARTSYGVYFGPDSRFNRCGMVSRKKDQTSLRAEIEALWQVLHVLDAEYDEGFGPVEDVFIFTDSEELVELTNEIDAARRRGGVDERGQPFRYFGRLARIAELWDDLAEGMSIRLEYMHGSYDLGAGVLSKLALDDEDRKENLNGLVQKLEGW